ncbi:hypothetical protein [Herbaspirillum rubrisubalbicans]|uniref:Uncharacterized protein n=1 Tax=Herbaspirillum rubrisubalbicans Os34 TaxID=1235827 RepID=A0A6M3ZTZ0_9BURK|nr:hypothetical protein [Herbaspirillum rubrisubalbicans]QJQ01693.1 hypothetical protein C798_16035 [Herbaspirillum rubrisubalbicans Os34]
MNQLDILIPFALPPAELARDLLRQSHAPALAMLLGRGKAAPRQAHDPFSRALPHEHWLAQRFGLPPGAQDSSPAAASALMQGLGHAPQAGHWFVLHPAHIHVARDHLVLTDIGQLQLQEEESRRLFAAALPLFTEIGHELVYGDERTWFIRADAWAGLRTSTPSAASGRNVDIWMPEGPGELAWRKLQNEVQMQWFAESLNEQREMRGQKAINSIWIWGGADAGISAQAHYTQSFGLRGWLRAFGADSGQTGAAEVAKGSGQRLLVLDALAEAALAEEWGLWLQHLEHLDRDWLAPLLVSLRAGTLASLNLILTGADRSVEVAVTRASLRRFWRKPSLSGLSA